MYQREIKRTRYFLTPYEPLFTLMLLMRLPLEIHPHAIYTSNEAQLVLKISRSTMKRLLKQGLIRANKIGRQYRILGKELLRLVSPEYEEKAEQVYMKMKKRVVRKMNQWSL